MMHFSQIYPFPEGGFDYIEFLKNANLVISVENNATGQFAKLMQPKQASNLPARS